MGEPLTAQETAIKALDEVLHEEPAFVANRVYARVKEWVAAAEAAAREDERRRITSEVGEPSTLENRVALIGGAISNRLDREDAEDTARKEIIADRAAVLAEVVRALGVEAMRECVEHWRDYPGVLTGHPQNCKGDCHGTGRIPLTLDKLVDAGLEKMRERIIQFLEIKRPWVDPRSNIPDVIRALPLREKR